MIELNAPRVRHHVLIRFWPSRNGSWCELTFAPHECNLSRGIHCDTGVALFPPARRIRLVKRSGDLNAMWDDSGSSWRRYVQMGRCPAVCVRGHHNVHSMQRDSVNPGVPGREKWFDAAIRSERQRAKGSDSHKSFWFTRPAAGAAAH
jgi:hypothetical protein